MKDNLREYIQEHKASFDEHRAPAGLWDDIADEIEPATGGGWWQYGIVAVLVAAMLLGGYFFIKNKKDDNSASRQSDPLEFASVGDYEETRDYYMIQASTTYKQLKAIHQDDQLEQDLQIIDANDAELRAELDEAEGLYKEHIIRALIKNQQVKLELLNNVLIQIQSAEKSNEYETI